MSVTRTLLASMLIAFLSQGLSLIKGQVREADEPFRVEVDAVNLLVTVNDKFTGKFIKDLNLDDFRVKEDGRQQALRRPLARRSNPDHRFPSIPGSALRFEPKGPTC